jgi:hypothetical protein
MKRMDMSDEQKGGGMTRVKWLYAGAVVAAALGIWRLLMVKQMSILGIPVSCGNGFEYLGGRGNGHPGYMLVCGPSMRSAAVEGLVLLLVALALLIAAIWTARKTGGSSIEAMRNPNPAAPGWYQVPEKPGCERWWDGQRWTVERPVAKESD